MEHILPQSRQPQPLVVGSTSLKGIEALSGILREFEPMMLRTEPTTAEVVQYVRKLARSNEHSLAEKILDVCASIDAAHVIRTANLWWKSHSISGHSNNGDPQTPASIRQRG